LLPLENNVKRVTATTAEKRNRFMIELADVSSAILHTRAYGGAGRFQEVSAR
jgi:hypothetical protein